MSDIVTDKYTLHRGDCLEYMKTMPDKSVDAVITDPPYGKKYTLGKNHGFGNNKTAFVDNINDLSWDKKPNADYFTEIFRIGDNQIIWGMNYFIDYLTPTNCIVVWDKQNGKNPFADVELAWTSYKRPSKIFRYFWLGSHIHRIEEIYHPTQKPTALMKWLVEKFTNEGDTIFDPFMGSGTTGVACMQLGRKFIGCEIDEKYFAIAEKRIREAAMQEIMFK